MSWRVQLSRSARQDLRRLDRRNADRVIAALARLAETERGDLKVLHGPVRDLRLCVGDWRVRFTFDREHGTSVVHRILPRGRAYRDWFRDL